MNLQRRDRREAEKGFNAEFAEGKEKSRRGFVRGVELRGHGRIPLNHTAQRQNQYTRKLQAVKVYRGNNFKSFGFKEIGWSDDSNELWKTFFRSKKCAMRSEQ